MSVTSAVVLFAIVVYCLICYSSAKGDGSFNDALQYYGRYLYNASSNRLEANWPSSGFKFIVLQESHDHDNIQVDILFATYADSHYYINAYLNCEFYSKYLISSNQSMVSLQLLSNTSKAIHHFDFRKVTEAAYSNAKGMLSLEYINVANGRIISEDMAVGLLGQPPHYYYNNKKCRVHNKHKMLVVGDSLTAAYGVDGNNPCVFDASLEDVTHGYAYIIANELQADLHTIAWSGKGVVRNYGDINQLSVDPMPVYYNRTIATVAVTTTNGSDFPSNYWNPSLFPADIIIVMLGSNDYSTTPHPNDEDFIEGLVMLIDRIKIDYPDAINHIALMCAAHNNGNQCMNIEEATRKTRTKFISIDPDVYDGGYGCDLHPNALTQQYMADYVAPLIEAMLLQ